jgi:hypothetical protein
MLALTLVEQVVSMSIHNPSTRGVSRTFVFMGKVDRVDMAACKVIDWKTTDDIPKAIQMLRLGFQPECYALAINETTPDAIREVEYRFVVRPTIKYKHPKFTWAVIKPGAKKALKVFDKLADAEEMSRTRPTFIEKRCRGNPTRDHYEQECVDWLCTSNTTETYGHALTSSKLEQARWYLWESAQRVIESRRNDRWLPNTRACWAWQRECPFAELCDCVQNGADFEWIIKQQFDVCESSHPELSGADKGKEVLTISSIGDLLSCGMFYYWKHERLLKRQSDEGGEALRIGSAMHAGMEGFADGGLETARTAIDEWADKNPIIGEDAAWKQDEQVAKARAMVQVAAKVWA